MSPTILLRSSWQTVNIGDVAHSPGALRALRRWAPHARVVLWPRDVDDREREMFASAFPEVAVVDGLLREDGTATTAELATALDAADVLVHGSGPGLVCADDLQVWARTTGKPYGFFGVTVDPLGPAFPGTLDELEAMVRALEAPVLDEDTIQLLSGASFVYCRDSLTELHLRSLGLACPVVEFGPDATFAFDVLDERYAAGVKDEYGLRDGEYLCAVPRLRWTPYRRLRDLPRTPQDTRREAYNAVWTDHDLGVLAAAVIAYVRRTGRPALVVPEMVYAVELAQQYFPDRLPADVREHVHVLPRFWSAPEAMTVYRDAEAVVSMECHAPLMATSQGTPAVYLRQPTDTVKGRMYEDVGAGDRVVEVSRGGPALQSALARILDHPAAAREQTARTRARAHERLRQMVGVVVESARAVAGAPSRSA